jgi:hypothetical protein
MTSPLNLCRFSFVEAEDATPDSLCQDLNIEIDEQADLPPAELQVSQQLRFMQGLESVYSFQLNDEGVVYQKVQTISAIQVDFAITDWKGHLPLKRDPQVPQLMTETDLIGRFHKPWPKGPMDIDRRSDDPFAELILFHASLSRESSDPALLFVRLRSCGFSASSVPLW